MATSDGRGRLIFTRSLVPPAFYKFDAAGALKAFATRFFFGLKFEHTACLHFGIPIGSACVFGDPEASVAAFGAPSSSRGEISPEAC